MFPEYSRFVYLNTNTIPMQKVCPKLEGYRHDIFAIQGDQNPQSTLNIIQIIGYTN